ncbi:PPM-type phosphatase domain [Arabidopsis thaliana x Arabidopsis arenosa]|uniref:protein-serine/threonine phosphatase n=1 Tax=Arabidopsis thaliana x Arabidopsis arenosa TaxID=1240361 RepID=A0A8T1XNS2_9BRAS|nr:PPM-type phosphatase domain [Arabidopsis thaliana x Arabidopsis arenosa]
MLSLFINFLTACLWPSSSTSHTYSDSKAKQDGLLWFKDSAHHLFGDFSMALVQANNLLEDQSQVESGPLSTLSSSGPFGTFVGIYDGHGGPETSRFVNDHLFHHLKIKPHIAAVGSCCLVGVVCDGKLYVANVGDSRAVLGKVIKVTGEIIALQLSAEHNVSIESVRQEMHSLHPDDSHIVLLKHNVWRVKGLIQVSRSIGDVYLKKAEFNREPLYTKYRLREPMKRPILNGLWEQLSNQEAVEVVQNHPRNGIARRLVKAALQEAAKKREMRYSDLNKIERGVRRLSTMTSRWLSSSWTPIC